MRPHESENRVTGKNIRMAGVFHAITSGLEQEMEKRYSKRLPVVMNVLIYDKNIPVVSCKTHDIGLDGLFINSGPLTYRNDTMLKIEFQLESESGTESHLLPAIVVRRSKSGLGLMLPGGDSQAIKAWRHKIRQSVAENPVYDTNETLSEHSRSSSTVSKSK